MVAVLSTFVLDVLRIFKFEPTGVLSSTQDPQNPTGTAMKLNMLHHFYDKNSVL